MSDDLCCDVELKKEMPPHLRNPWRDYLDGEYPYLNSHMYCSLITFLCVVGGVQAGPEAYKIDVYNQMDKAFYEVYVPIQHKDQVIHLLKF